MLCAPAGFAPIPIGFCLTLIHLIGIPVTNLSVNPARSTGPAIFVGGWAIEQLWMFWLAPIIGAVIGGYLYRSLFEECQREAYSIVCFSVSVKAHLFFFFSRENSLSFLKNIFPNLQVTRAISCFSTPTPALRVASR